MESDAPKIPLDVVVTHILSKLEDGIPAARLVCWAAADYLRLPSVVCHKEKKGRPARAPPPPRSLLHCSKACECDIGCFNAWFAQQPPPTYDTTVTVLDVTSIPSRYAKLLPPQWLPSSLLHFSLACVVTGDHLCQIVNHLPSQLLSFRLFRLGEERAMDGNKLADALSLLGNTCTRLQHLSLTYIAATSEQVFESGHLAKLVAAFTCLETLELDGNVWVTDESLLIAWAENGCTTTLKRLSLYDTCITNDGIRKASSVLARLERLSLSSQIDLLEGNTLQQVFESPHYCSRLTYLELSSVSNEARILRKTWPWYQTLKTLILSGEEDFGEDDLVDALKTNNCVLEVLHVAFFSSQMLRGILCALATNTTLVMLDIYHMGMELLQDNEVIEALALNTTLRTLNLRLEFPQHNVDLTPSLKSWMPRNRSLQVLDICGTLSHLITCLQYSSVLCLTFVVTNYNNNNNNSDCKQKLITAVQHNKTLHHLIVRGKYYDWACDLVEAVVRNNTLTELDIDSPRVIETKWLHEILNHNKSLQILRLTFEQIFHIHRFERRVLMEAITQHPTLHVFEFGTNQYPELEQCARKKRLEHAGFADKHRCPCTVCDRSYLKTIEAMMPFH